MSALAADRGRAGGRGPGRRRQPHPRARASGSPRRSAAQAVPLDCAAGRAGRRPTSSSPAPARSGTSSTPTMLTAAVARPAGPAAGRARPGPAARRRPGRRRARPASPWSTSRRSRAALADQPSTRPTSRRPARSSPRRSPRFLGWQRGRQRRADRGRAARHGRRGGRRRAGPARPAGCPDLDDRSAGRDRADRAPGRRQAAARADRAGEAARRASPAAQSYAEALRELFDLDPQAVEAGHAGPTSRPTAGDAPDDRRVHRPRALRLGTRRSALAMAQSGQVADALTARTGRRRRARRGDDDGDTSRERARPDRRHRRLRHRAARRAARAARSTSPCTRSRTCRPPQPDGSCSPRCRRARTRATRWSPATGSTLGELPRRRPVGTGSPRRAAQLRALGLGLEVVADPRQRRHPARLVARRRARRGRPRPRRPGPARPARRGHRGRSTRSRCCPPPARARWRSSAAPTTGSTESPTCSPCSTTPHTRAAVTAERALLAALEAGCSAPVGALADAGRRRARSRAVPARPSSAP